MLCPCCGVEMQLQALECGCGARIVGEPLAEQPFKVKRYGPVMGVVGAMFAVVTASLVFTLWAACSAVVIVWLAVRAIRLSKREPDLYGGYRLTAAVLALTVTAGAVVAGYELYRFPEFLQNRKIRQAAQTEATMYHIYAVLEDYKAKNGSYPANGEAIRKLIGSDLPADFWDQSIRYRSYTEAVAAASLGSDHPGIQLYNFELRSAGPDGKLGTDDDIVMRDGVLCTSREILTQPIGKDAPDTK